MCACSLLANFVEILLAKTEPAVFCCHTLVLFLFFHACAHDVGGLSAAASAAAACKLKGIVG